MKAIQDKNRVLAEFMGAIWHENFYCYIMNYMPESPHYAPNNLIYHESLDWLWPVWCKFRDLELPAPRINYRWHVDTIARQFRIGDIAEIHEALYNAIVWYNENK